MPLWSFVVTGLPWRRAGRGRARWVCTAGPGPAAGPGEAAEATEGDEGQPRANIRFVNAPGGPVEVVCAPGRRLLEIGDEAGVRIPRGCLTGICGTCTVEVDGQTTRACQVKVGTGALVVDCWRMGEENLQPMKRFDGVEFGGVGPRSVVRGRLRECADCGGLGELVCPCCEGTGFDLEDKTQYCLLCVGRMKVMCATCQATGLTEVKRGR